MSLTKDQVKHVAKLSALTLSEEEIEKLEKQLSETLDFIKELDKIDTKNIEPTYSVTGLENVFRDDETAPSLTQDEVLQNARNKSEGYFKVKAIFDES